MSPSDRRPKIPLRVVTEDDSTAIRILDSDLREIGPTQVLGEVEVSVPPGVYEVELRRGREVESRPVLVRDHPVLLQVMRAQEPRFASAAPVEGTSTSREAHQAGAVSLSHAPALERHAAPGFGHLMLFARSSHGALGRAPKVSVHDLDGSLRFDLARGEAVSSAGWFGQHLTLDPGGYRVRRKSRRGFYEQIVHVVEGWQTQFFLLYEVRDPNHDRSMPRLSVLMAKPSAAFNPDGELVLWTESALRALEDGSSLPGRDTQGMFLSKFENPMLGIYAGLLHLRRPTINPDLMRTVFENLYHMVGPAPDVLAIGWGLARQHGATRRDKGFMARLHNPDALAVPPMLRESWLHLSLASATNPDVFGISSFAARAAVNLTTSRPWLVWEGEPPELEIPSVEAISGRRGLVTRVLDGLKGILAAPTTDLLLPMTRNALRDVPDAGYRLRHPEFTQLERSIARLLDPLVDPSLARMTEESVAFRRAIRRSRETSEAFTATTLIERLSLPPPTITGSVWGLYRKLVLQAMPPLGIHLTQFARGEAQGSETLEGLLARLREEETPVVHRASGKPLDALQLLFLRYRGRPGFTSGRPVTRQVIAELTRADYVAEGRSLTTHSLKTALDAARDTFVGWVENADFGDRALAENWRDAVFVNPARYERGKLLEGMLAEAEMPAEAEDWTELQLIDGIGPKTQRVLREAGVMKLEDLAHIADGTITSVDEVLPGVRTRLERLDWRGQAQELTARPPESDSAAD